MSDLNLNFDTGLKSITMNNATSDQIAITPSNNINSSSSPLSQPTQPTQPIQSIRSIQLID